MDKFEYEKLEIQQRIKGLSELGKGDLYAYKKGYMKDSLIEANMEITINNLSNEVINDVQKEVLDYCEINFSNEEVCGFLKLHPQTALTIIKFGIDTESAGRIHSDLFNWFLYEMPSPLNGHKLSEQECNDYFKLLKEAASLYGFDTV